MTPAIDALAAAGVRFTQYRTSPNCSPTRMMMMTGRHPSRTGITEIIAPPSLNGGYGSPGNDGWEPAGSEVFIATRLNTASYDCGLMGKWHLHHPASALDYDFVRQKGGFDAYRGWPWNFRLGPIAGVPVAGCESYTSFLYNAAVNSCNGWGRIVADRATASGSEALNTGGAPAPGNIDGSGGNNYCATYATTQVADDAINFIQTATPPFYCVAAFHSAHFPLQAPPSTLYTTGHSGTNGKARLTLPSGYGGAYGAPGANVPDGGFYLDLLANAPTTTSIAAWRAAIMYATDAEVKRVIDAANAVGNTIIIFCTDNGSQDQVGSDGDWISGYPDPSRVKSSMYEGGIHCPLIVSESPGTGLISRPGRTSNQMVAASDLYATLHALANISVDTTNIKDSRSFLNALTNTVSTNPRKVQISVLHDPMHDPATWSANVFVKRWYCAVGEFTSGFPEKTFYKLVKRVVDSPAVELYNLNDDPLELNNLAPNGLTPAKAKHSVPWRALNAHLNNHISAVEGLIP